MYLQWVIYPQALRCGHRMEAPVPKEEILVSISLEYVILSNVFSQS